MFNKILFLLLFVCFFSCKTSTESSFQNNSYSEVTQPKLVVGVVVDQMRFEYLNRFKSKYSSQGFLKLMNQGFSCNNHHFNYIFIFIFSIKIFYRTSNVIIYIRIKTGSSC